MKQLSQLHTALGTTGRLSALLCIAAGMLQSTFAADKTWDGGGDQSSWSGSPANWDLDTAPVANDRLFFDGGIGLFPNNNFAADTDFGGITFNPGAGAFTISGSEIDLAANAGVTNLSSNVQTISANIDNNGANKVHNAFAGDLVYTGVFRNNTVIKEGAFSLTTGGPTGNSAPGLIVNDGTVIMAKAAGNAFAGNILVNTNGTARIVGGASGHVDQIHFNTRVIMNGGKWQLQHFDSITTTKLEEIASLSGSNLNSIVEGGLAASTNTVRIGGGNGHRAIYSGTVRDGAAGVINVEVYRGNNFQQFNGTNTYTGVTLVNNVQTAGSTRYILNGAHIGGGAYTVNGNAVDRFAYLNGSGIISASVININGQGLIAPGGSLSADLADAATFADSIATLTISNAVNLNASTSTLEMQVNGTSAGVSHDQLVIAGAGSLSNNNANLKIILGYTPQNGDKITLVQVQGTSAANNVGIFGSLNGAVTDLSQGATFIEPSSGQNLQISYRAEGSTFDMGAGNGNDIMIRVVSSAGTNLTWRGDVNNLWDVQGSANWRTLSGVQTTFTNFDNVTFNDTSATNGLVVDLQGDLNPGNITVSSASNFVFASSVGGRLTGTVVLTKTNTGTLTILTDNNNAGSTLVRAGTLRVGTNGTSGVLSGAVDIRTNATVIFDRSDASTFAGAITGGGTLIHNGTNGTLSLTANSTYGGTVFANAGTLQFGDGTGISGSVAGRVANNATVAYNYNNAANINNSLSGTGMVELINSTLSARKFTIANAVTNTGFSGTFHVNPYVCLNTPDLSNGTNQLGIGSTVYVEDTGSVYLDRGGYYLSTFVIQGAGNGAGSAGTPVTLEIEGLGAPTITTIAGDVHVLSSATIGGFIGISRISGRLIDTNGVSTITFANGRGPGTGINLQLGSVSGPNHWADTIIDPDLSGGAFTITAMTPSAISTNALTLGAHGNFALNGNNHTLGRLQSTAVGGSILNSSASTAAVLSVGADSTSSTFDGFFADGGAASLGVTKVGAGALTLSANSTSTGPVTVAEGSIALTADGSFSNATSVVVSSGAVLDVTTRNDGSLNLQNGQTLKGNGGVNGNLVTLAGSVVNPGASIGTLTVSNNATLGGTLLMEVNRAASPNADSLVVVGTLTAGGTLAVTNIGTTLQVNDTFQLFPAGVSGFTVALPTTDIVNGVNYTWQNDVASLGSVKVLSVAPVPPPNLSVSQAGNVLTFSWTGAFKLQSQTNSLTTGLGNNWSDYPGGGTSPVNVTINPANPTVFFRLKL
ncbi:MAG: hypothetical protein U1F83_05035 [Verrucomicrobiota bacterium]